MPLLSAGLTDIGRKRKSNQDSIYMNPERRVYIVADGMGGHSGGDIASALAVKHLPDYLDKHATAKPDAALVASIKFTNQVIKKTAEDNPKLKGMGTTIVSTYFKGDTLYIANVGDSRAYLINKKCIYQITKDHSLVQEKINMGIYSRQEGQKDPQKNVLIRTVGFEDTIGVDLFTYKIIKNDIFILCSDGLHGRVSDSDMLFVINKNINDPSKCSVEDLNRTVKELVNLANENGGNDNISVVLVLAQ